MTHLPSGSIDLNASRQTYRGRFAPTPSGPLHFGSLVAALGSYLQAKSQQGQWLLRIEDIDPPREMAGAADDIIHTLDQYGFEWDEGISYQSQRSELYLDSLSELQHQGMLYACTCSRSQLSANGNDGIYPNIYPGHCRDQKRATSAPHSLRVITDDAHIEFTDIVQGRIHFDFARESGDFIVRRRDMLFSYQLAVALDDAEQQISQVVRGADLLDSTPRQFYLQQLMNVTAPEYAHLPVATNENGQKLSKQNHAPALPKHKPVPILCHALGFLGQMPPAELLEADLDSFWKWAISHWQLSAVPRRRQIVDEQNPSADCLND